MCDRFECSSTESARSYQLSQNLCILITSLTSDTNTFHVFFENPFLGFAMALIHGHMLTGEMLTGQMLTGQLLTGQMLTPLSKHRTNAHKCVFVRYNLGMENWACAPLPVPA